MSQICYFNNLLVLAWQGTAPARPVAREGRPARITGVSADFVVPGSDQPQDSSIVAARAKWSKGIKMPNENLQRSKRSFIRR